MTSSFKIISILLASTILSCSSEQKPVYYVSSDFTGAEFTAGIEGPATDEDKLLYAVNFKKEGTIGIVDQHGNADLFVELPEGSIGNSIRFDSKWNLLVADYTGHNVLWIDKRTKEIKVFAHDSTMNQPNDLAITSTDLLFASDPNWKENKGKLWSISQDGKTKLLEDNMGTTNGIEVSPGDSLLYVNESVQRNVWVYRISPDGTISQKKLLIKFQDHGMDGMKCDEKGNLYITRYGKGTVAVVSPEGKLIREVKLKGSKPTNIVFGGKEGKTCFVTLQDRGVIEKFECEFKGKGR